MTDMNVNGLGMYKIQTYLQQKKQSKNLKRL